MFKIRFVKTDHLAVFDESDMPWVPMLQRFDTEKEAAQEAKWLELDDATYTYEVVPAPEGHR